jgi:hypothetical protein
MAQWADEGRALSGSYRGGRIRDYQAFGDIKNNMNNQLNPANLPPLNIVVRPEDYRYGDGRVPFKLRGITTENWGEHFEFQVWQLLKTGDTDDCWDYGGIKGVDAFIDALISEGVLPTAVVNQFISWGFMDVGIDSHLHFHSSPRFPGVMTGIGQNGGNVTTELDFAKGNGLVPFTMLPVTQDMTLDEYFDPKAITQEMKDIAMQFRNLMGGKDFILYQWIVDGGATNIPKMAEAQPLGPYSLGIPVNNGWNQVHPTIATGSPCHVVSGYDVQNGSVFISDNYSPFNKILDPGYQISFVLQIIVQYIPPPPAPTLPPNPTVPQEISWLTQIANWLRNIFDPASLGAARSPQWSGVEKAYRKLHPTCEVCGTKGTLTNPLNVHHIAPFHLHPELELSVDNLWTMCRQHHFFFGHFDDWSSFNTTVKADSALWISRIENRTE